LRGYCEPERSGGDRQPSPWTVEREIGAIQQKRVRATRRFPWDLVCARLQSNQVLGATLRRRKFIAGLGSVAAWPVAAWAQQSQSLRRVGVLLRLADGDPETNALLGGFRLGLHERGLHVHVADGQGSCASAEPCDEVTIWAGEEVTNSGGWTGVVTRRLSGVERVGRQQSFTLSAEFVAMAGQQPETVERGSAAFYARPARCFSSP
jgi:hypothetical protein